MVSDCSSPVCDTVGTYHKGNNLRGSSDGLTNIPLLLKEPDLKLTQALELIILKYFLSLKEFQLKRNLGWLQMVIGVMRGSGNSGWFCPGCVNVSQHIANRH